MVKDGDKQDNHNRGNGVHHQTAVDGRVNVDLFLMKVVKKLGDIHRFVF